MAVIQGLRGNVRNAFHGTGNGRPGGGGAVQRLHHADIDLPVGIVLDHADLLCNDTLLLADALLREPGDGHKGQQNLQILHEMVGTVKVVAGHGIGGKSVGLRTVLGKILQCVAFFRVKHLMLQIMGDTRGGIQPFAV